MSYYERNYNLWNICNNNLLTIELVKSKIL